MKVENTNFVGVWSFDKLYQLALWAQTFVYLWYWSCSICGADAAEEFPQIFQTKGILSEIRVRPKLGYLIQKLCHGPLKRLMYWKRADSAKTDLLGWNCTIVELSTGPLEVICNEDSRDSTVVLFCYDFCFTCKYTSWAYLEWCF